MKAFLTSILVQLFLMIYVFYHLWIAAPSGKAWKRTVACSFFALLAAYLTGYFFHQELSDGVLHFLLSAYGIWYVAVIYIALLLAMTDAARLAWRKRVKITPASLAMIAAVAAGLLCCGYYSFRHPKVKYRTVHIAKAAGKMDSVSIVLATDIHAGYVVGREHLKRYVDLINACRCDLILLGGDMIDYDLHILNARQMDVEFRRLKAPLGVYAVLGNHEHRFNTAKKREWLERCGMIVLQDSVAMPSGTSFYLIGRDDKKNRSRKSLDYLLAGLDRTKPLILADHQPFSVGEALMHGVDFMMSGHTHNGQIWPNNFLMRYFYDGFSEGYKKSGSTQVYTSSGLGVSGPPFRVFTDSEIVVFKIFFLASEG
jgi:predicted MPP superfamily phosphohydrolase